MRTNWKTADIWLRRTFELPAGFAAVQSAFLLHHDEDAEVYINGVLALKVAGYSTDYEFAPMTPEARAALQAGPQHARRPLPPDNRRAVH